jgi:uncharacterized protein YgiM (DUF1202 family)
MTTQEQSQTTKESTGSVILKVILIVAGVGLVLVIGIWLGRTLAGETLPESPEIIPPPPPSNGPYVVTNYAVNVRSGPGTDFDAYGVAPPGASAEIIGVSPDQGWWMVRVPTTVSSDGTAWVSAEYVTAYNTDQVPVPEPFVEP